MPCMVDQDDMYVCAHVNVGQNLIAGIVLWQSFVT